MSNWCQSPWYFQNAKTKTVVPEKSLESPLDSKKIKPDNPKGNQPWILIRRTAAEADAQILWHLMQRADSLEKILMLERLKVGEGGDRGWDGWMTSQTQWTCVWTNSGRLWRTGKPGMICSWDCKELDTTQWLNNSNTC